MRQRYPIASLVLLLLTSAASGQSPWYMSIEAGGDHGFTNRASSAENEITIGRKFNVPLNFFVEGSNRVDYEDAWSDELSLGAGIRFFDRLAFSLHSVFVVAPGFDLIIKPALGLSWEFEDAGLCLNDLNECPVYVLSGEVEYENLFDCELSLDITRKAFLLLGISNDFLWDGEISEVLKPSVGFEAGRFSMRMIYGLSSAPTLGHSLGVELAYSIGDYRFDDPF
jgi:hypothetical protein